MKRRSCMSFEEFREKFLSRVWGDNERTGISRGEFDLDLGGKPLEELTKKGSEVESASRSFHDV